MVAAACVATPCAVGVMDSGHRRSRCHRLRSLSCAGFRKMAWLLLLALMNRATANNGFGSIFRGGFASRATMRQRNWGISRSIKNVCHIRGGSLSSESTASKIGRDYGDDHDDRIETPAILSVHLLADPDEWNDVDGIPEDLRSTSSPSRRPGSSVSLADRKTGRPSRTVRDLQDDWAETATLLSDVVVLLASKENTYGDIDSVFNAAKRRLDAGLPPSALVVVAPPGVQGKKWKENLVMSEKFASIMSSESLWRDLHIVTIDDGELERLWESGALLDMSKNEYILESLAIDTGDGAVSMAEISKLFQTVYHSLGGLSDSSRLDWDVTQHSNEVDIPSGNKTESTTQYSARPKVDSVLPQGLVPEDEEIVQAAIAEAQTRMDELELELDAFWLESMGEDDELSEPGASSLKLPMLDFGAKSSAIWSELYELTVSGSQKSSSFIPLLQPAALRLQSLFKQHLSALRNYYGLRYEKILEKTESKKDAAGWSESASHLVDGFRTAAQHSTPKPSNGDSADMMLEIADFGYVMTLQGLITDMMEATQSRKEELSILDDEDFEDDDDTAIQEKPLTKWQIRRRRWLKILLSRSITLAVNYAQGWLAYQGIKRAAVERDRGLPKFPLF